MFSAFKRTHDLLAIADAEINCIAFLFRSQPAIGTAFNASLEVK